MSLTPAPLSPLDLLKRQLLDWQQFYADMICKPETAQQDLDYMQQQIDRLTEEITQYAAK